MDAPIQKAYGTLSTHSPAQQAVIRAESTPRIKDIDDDKLKTCLAWVLTFLGVPEDRLPEEIYKQVLIDFIRTEYANLRIDEIKQAYTVAGSGKSGVDLSIFLDAKSFGKVMKAYQDYKQKVKRSIKQAPPAPPVERTETPEQAYNYLLDYIKQNNALPYGKGGNWLKAYRHAEEHKLIDLDPKKMLAFVNEVKQDLATEAMEGSKAIKVMLYKITSIPENFKNECRIRYIKQHFKTILNNAETKKNN